MCGNFVVKNVGSFSSVSVSKVLFKSWKIGNIITVSFKSWVLGKELRVEDAHCHLNALVEEEIQICLVVTDDELFGTEKRDDWWEFSVDDSGLNVG